MAGMRIGKYACLEIERRYLLAELPAGIGNESGGWRIVDRYIVGTRLRLRRMEALAGDEVVYKLGQKYVAEGQGAAESTMTNLYLNEAEYGALAALEARVLVKRRYPFWFEGRAYSVDVFEGAHEGLALAEIECETAAACAALATPPFALRDVTEEAFFRGGYLASLTRETFEKEFALWR